MKKQRSFNKEKSFTLKESNCFVGLKAKWDTIPVVEELDKTLLNDFWLGERPGCKELKEDEKEFSTEEEKGTELKDSRTTSAIDKIK